MSAFMRNLVVNLVVLGVAVGVVVPVTLLANAVDGSAGKGWAWVAFLGGLAVASAVIGAVIQTWRKR